MDKNYEYYDSKNIKIFIESTFEFGAEFFYKIAISFRTKLSDYDDQFVQIGNFIEKKSFFKTRNDAEKTAFNFAKKIEQFTTNKISWFNGKDVKFEDGKIYAVKNDYYRNDIIMVIFKKQGKRFTTLTGNDFYGVDLVADFDFS